VKLAILNRDRNETSKHGLNTENSKWILRMNNEGKPQRAQSIASKRKQSRSLRHFAISLRSLR